MHLRHRNGSRSQVPAIVADDSRSMIAKENSVAGGAKDGSVAHLLADFPRLFLTNPGTTEQARAGGARRCNSRPHPHTSPDGASGRRRRQSSGRRRERVCKTASAYANARVRLARLDFMDASSAGDVTNALLAYTPVHLDPDSLTDPLLITPNVDELVKRDRHADPVALALAGRARWVLADGQPIVWASRLFRTLLQPLAVHCRRSSGCDWSNRSAGRSYQPQRDCRASASGMLHSAGNRCSEARPASPQRVRVLRRHLRRRRRLEWC